MRLPEPWLILFSLGDPVSQARRLNGSRRLSAATHYLSAGFGALDTSFWKRGSFRSGSNIAPLQLGKEVFRVHFARLDEALVTAALYVDARDLKSVRNAPNNRKKRAEATQLTAPLRHAFDVDLS